MNPQWKTTLLHTAVQTFEDLCFVSPEAEIAAQPRNTPVDAAVRVTFWGPFKGTLVLTLYGGLLPGLAADMLGEDTIPPEHQQYDALGEIANVICGNVLPKIAGSEEVFQLQAPEMATPQGTTGEEVSVPAAEAQFGLGQGCVKLQLFTDRAAAPIVEESHR
jgi:hypothetical protein